MAHFAKLNDNNEVIEIHVVNNAVLDKNNEEQSGIEFLTQWSGGYTNWKQTSFNGKIRFNYAGIGYSYDEKLDAFIAPQPYPSWKLNNKCQWEAPKPLPTDGLYSWQEDTQTWVKID